MPDDRPFLYEMEVIDAVERFLLDRKFKTTRKVSKVTARGEDLVMEATSGAQLHMEAKGQGSSQSRTNRYGDEFTDGQKEDHLGQALVRSLEVLGRGQLAGIALPGDGKDANLIRSISSPLGRLGLLVFLVDPATKSVTLAVGTLPT